MLAGKDLLQYSISDYFKIKKTMQIKNVNSKTCGKKSFMIRPKNMELTSRIYKSQIIVYVIPKLYKYLVWKTINEQFVQI